MAQSSGIAASLIAEIAAAEASGDHDKASDGLRRLTELQRLRIRGES